MINKNNGLTEDEAIRRLNIYGLNVLSQGKSISAIKIFFSQFNDFIIWVLMGATVISGFMGAKADAITILIIIIMNGILGFIQEFKTEKSLDELKKLASPTAKVKRNGKIKVISSEEIVPGDIIILEAGDRISADSEIIKSNNLKVDESLLTGESEGVSKGEGKSINKLYMGTIVLTGKGMAKVYATGMKTEMGKIAHMLNNIEEEQSPLKERLSALGKILVVACLIICAVVTIMGIVRGQNAYEMFLLGVSLAVAAIPEGLPAIVTVSLAIGVSKMLKRNALVRRLPAVETLGCTSIICSDKTGTLTENNMTVKVFYYNDSYYDLEESSKIYNENLKKAFTYCNDFKINEEEKNFHKSLLGDPTETALIKAFFKEKEEVRNFTKNIEKLYENPFNSEKKMMSTLVRENNKYISYVKGAPEIILSKCKYVIQNGVVKPLNSSDKKRILEVMDDMSNKALRCIGAAFKENASNKSNMEENLIFIGIAGIIDPPRKEVKDAVLRCRMAGIKPVMITGDHKNTAFAIGKEIGICKNKTEVITGEYINSLKDNELKKIVKEKTIFARVNPDHKYRIVKAFKENGHIVAMTGDGVNDAPAVKEADIGISMGVSGTDVTKEASSLILLDDNFNTIVSAVEEGRVIYNNIRKFIRYLLSCNLGEVLTMFLSALFYIEVPLLPIQILLVNLATDGLPALALGVDPSEDDLMMEKPRKREESIFARGLSEKIIIRGALIGVCTILSFLLGKYYGMDVSTCRTLALTTLIFSQLIHVFECRSEKHSIFEINFLSNIYLVLAVLISIIMVICVIYIPFLQNVFHTRALNFGNWCIVIFFSSIIAFVNGLYLFFKNK